MQTEYLNRLVDAVRSLVKEAESQIGFEITVRVDAAQERSGEKHRQWISYPPITSQRDPRADGGGNGLSAAIFPFARIAVAFTTPLQHTE